MSNPTELPDLDRIAKAMYVALNNIYQEGGCTPSDRDAVTEALGSYNRYRSLPARRAQPEGEAPKADKVTRLDLLLALQAALETCETKSGVPRMSHLATLNAVNAAINAATRAATLSPLCGAQHAESGEPDRNFHPEYRRGYAAARAAQQAAAPGLAKPELMRQAVASVVSRAGDDLRIAWLRPERCDVGTLLYCAVEQAAPSAPGTPEAPQPPFPVSDDEMAALRRFWECASDGEGYDVEKTMMQRLAEMGLVQRKSGAYYMVTEFGLYVLREYTIPRAAQLDGGQEGSESNG